MIVCVQDDYVHDCRELYVKLVRGVGLDVTLVDRIIGNNYNVQTMTCSESE